jgi:hypothetical protein
MVDVDSAFGQQLLDIPIRQAEPQIPAHRQHDHLAREPEAGERRASRNRRATFSNVLTVRSSAKSNCDRSMRQTPTENPPVN